MSKNSIPSHFVIIFIFLLFLCVSVAAQPPSAPCPWTGKWDTNWGMMTIDQKGYTITGTYEHDNGKITGRVIGNMIIGTWAEAPGYNPPDNAGDFQIVMADNCKTFTGNWKYGSREGSWDGEWYGSRVAGAVPSKTPPLTPARTQGTPLQTPVITPDMTAPPTESGSFLSGILPVGIPMSTITVIISLLVIAAIFVMRK